MDSYISVEMAIKHLRGEAAAKFPASFYPGLLAAADELKKLPAADVRPVVYAEWLTKERQEHYPSGKRYGADYCSNCGKRGSLELDFCPSCGADIRGRDERAKEEDHADSASVPAPDGDDANE